ncbi:MAG: hypothetical protein OEL76_10335 [Siculibacillus sp.]|nr:hypothetical protein [Siculibacillus sp.]
MIEFAAVDYRIRTAKGETRILVDMTGALPRGRYVLLTEDPQSRIALVDLFCGLKQPQVGRIVHHGRVSWPIGRLTHFRSGLDGYSTVEFFADIHALDRRRTLDFVREFCDLDGLLARRMTSWPGQASLRLGLGLALLPDFDIFVVDGSLLVGDPNFQRRWVEAFHERSRKGTVVMSTTQKAAIGMFCDYALIADHGRLFITEHVAEAIDLYPSRAATAEAPEPDDGDDID